MEASRREWIVGSDAGERMAGFSSTRVSFGARICICSIKNSEVGGNWLV